MSTVANKLQYL